MSMPSWLTVVCWISLSLLIACVDPLDLTQRQSIDVIVVDGLITNQAEAQIIQLNRTFTDSITGRSRFQPITRATVEVLVDSSLVLTCHETTDGRYQLPTDFHGQVGHTYQLRFTLSTGASYQSTQQIMQPVPPIAQVRLQFNPTSLAPNLLETNFRAGYDVLLDVQDPSTQQNYYRWEWQLFEKQDWCQSCRQGYYMPNQLQLVSSYPNALVYQTLAQPAEDCFDAPPGSLFGGAYTPLPLSFINAYVCRTPCWDIISSTTISLLADTYSNGGLITSRNVGQIPYYTQNPALVNIRQRSLTPDAYRYFSLLQQQTQNTGGLADGSPAALGGNVTNEANRQENVIGYFTVSAVSSVRSWLDKKDATGVAYGGLYYDPDTRRFIPVPGDKQLFYALTRIFPQQERNLNFSIIGGSSRPPTALCVPSEGRTPTKPAGWRD